MRSLRGVLLIASPSLVEPTFARTVILIIEHNEEGAAGLVLNRVSDVTVTEISEAVFQGPIEWEKPVHMGGPVSGPLTLLHEVEEISDLEVFPGLHHSARKEHVRQAVIDRIEPSIVLANYAGWGPGQLESEFDRDAWLTVPATLEYVFWTEEEDLWDVVVKSVNARRLSEFLGLRVIPDDPSMN